LVEAEARIGTFFAETPLSVGPAGRRNDSVQRKQRNRMEESGNGVNSSAAAALLPAQRKLRAMLHENSVENLPANN
jgi:hypothetical protein